MSPFVLICWRIRAGFPAAIVPGGMSWVTTLPAPTIAFSPIVTPHRMVALLPIEAPRLTSVGIKAQSASVCNPPPFEVARGYLSLMNMTP